MSNIDQKILESGGLEGPKPFWPMKPVWIGLALWVPVSLLFFTPNGAALFLITLLNVLLFVGALIATHSTASPKAYKVARERYAVRTRYRKEVEKEWVRFQDDMSAYLPPINQKLKELHKAGGPEPDEERERLKNDLGDFIRFIASGNPVRYFEWRKQVQVLDRAPRSIRKAKEPEKRETPDEKLTRKAADERARMKLESKLDKEMVYVATEIEAERFSGFEEAENDLVENKGYSRKQAKEIIWRVKAELEKRKNRS